MHWRTGDYYVCLAHTEASANYQACPICREVAASYRRMQPGSQAVGGLTLQVRRMAITRGGLLGAASPARSLALHEKSNLLLGPKLYLSQTEGLPCYLLPR
jgi:hypothetical protein